MNSFLFGAIAFGCAMGGALVGMLLQRVVPDHHLRQESKEVILLGAGFIATMAALVLGLLIATAASDFASQSNGFDQMATNVVLLDRILAQYGPEAKPSREHLRVTVASVIDRLRPATDSTSSVSTGLAKSVDANVIVDSIRTLSPRDETQRSLQAQAFQTSAELARTRWLLSEQQDGSIPRPFMAMLAFWIFVLFLIFGIFSPRNVTVIAVHFLCALSVAGAVLLVVDMDQPFEGLIQISSASLRNAQTQLNQ